jgi:hypothetical protein
MKYATSLDVFQGPVAGDPNDDADVISPWPNSKAVLETWNNKAEPPPTQAVGSSK